jgi:catechol 2,3-dioxygenase-like lactoylglutathione lyase family enzyme
MERIMKKVTLFKLYVTDQDAARRFYVEKLGFEVAEDKRLGDYRWLLVKAPDNPEFSINLEIARTDEEKALVGRQAAAQPLFSISTDDCRRDYQELKERSVRFEGEPAVMPYGTGVMLQDLYGNRIYLNQEPT